MLLGVGAAAERLGPLAVGHRVTPAAFVTTAAVGGEALAEVRHADRS
jgi:hypothetical protein